jgi:hypothetical protein
MPLNILIGGLECGPVLLKPPLGLLFRYVYSQTALASSRYIYAKLLGLLQKFGVEGYIGWTPRRLFMVAPCRTWHRYISIKRTQGMHINIGAKNGIDDDGAGKMAGGQQGTLRRQGRFRTVAVQSSPPDRKLFMPLVIFLILVVLIAMFGFWDTLSALLGSLMMIILFAAAAAGLLVLTGLFIYHRFKKRI